MNQPVTFFHKKQSAEGRTYVFNLESSTRVYRVLVYSPRTVEETVVQSQKLFDYHQQIGRIMQATGPGGIVVLTYEEERTRSFQVVPAGTADAIGRFGVLRPGSEMSLEEVKLEKWLETPAGSHILVPVDREAEEQLRQMKGFLDGLPPDLESLILYSLRKPSLDARIRDLEARQAKAAGGGMNQIREWLVPVLLVLVLILNGVLLYRTFRHEENTKDEPETTTQARGDGKDEKKEESGPATTAKYDQDVFAILQAVHGKDDFQALGEHFKGLNKGSDVTAALKNKDRAKPLVFGLIKLEALRLDAEAASGLLATADNPTALKDFFRDRSLPSDSKDMLAALACAGYGTPGMPESKGGTSKALSFDSQECSEFPLDKATPGLKKLLELAKSYKKPQG